MPEISAPETRAPKIGALTVEIQQRAPQPALAIRIQRSLSEIPQAMAEVLPEVWQAAAGQGLAPTMPYARYFAFDQAAIDFEAGVLLDRPAVSEAGRAQPVELPGGEVAVAWHIGPYERLADTYAAMGRWIAAAGRAEGGPMWEVYWDDPHDVPQELVRTEVLIPLA